MPKRYLVTGCAGFIGSNLCSYLLSRGHKVIGIDNLSTGYMENLERVQALAGGDFQYVIADICDAASVRKCLSFQPDAVIHLAAQGSVQKSFDDLVENNRSNIEGFTAILTGALESNVNAFIFASSCAIYGDSNSLPIDENNDINPLSPYASTKYFNELISDNLSRRYPATSILGLRFFNIYGPWQDPNGAYAAVIPKWVDAHLNGEQAVIFGDGSATRDFCSVLNVSQLIESLTSEKALSGAETRGAYNIATGKSTSLRELHDCVVAELRRCGVRIKYPQPMFSEWRDGDILHSSASIAAAVGELNYSPQVNLRDGIRMLISEQYDLS